MEQLSGFDATFLALESTNQTGHVASLAVYEAAEISGGSFYGALRSAARPVYTVGSPSAMGKPSRKK